MEGGVIGSSDRYRYTPRHRRSLEDRVGQAHRRSGADRARDALVAALEQWPESGVPRNPGAWLMAAAKHRAIDHLRRNKRLERKHEELGREIEAKQEMAVADFDAAID